MFASKSSELLRLLKLAARDGENTICVKPRSDNRYSETAVVTHDGRQMKAALVDHAEDILKLPDIERYDVVGIDEAQFFEGSLRFVCETLMRQGIDVFVAGLDLDYREVPFGSMPALLAISDTVDKRTAICTVCGSVATRSQRIVDSQDQIVVGGSSAYEARCRKHWSPEPVFSRREAQGELDG